MERRIQQGLTVQALQREMAALEVLAATDWESSCRQMFALYPLAGERYMHDVCDSIDLWIFENKLTARLTNELGRMISNENDASLKHHYEGWLTRQ